MQEEFKILDKLVSNLYFNVLNTAIRQYLDSHFVLIKYRLSIPLHE